MRSLSLGSRAGACLIFGIVAVAGGLGAFALDPRVQAQDEIAADASADAPVKAATKRKRHAAPKIVEAAKGAVAQDAAPSPPPASASIPPAAPAPTAAGKTGAEQPPFDFAAQLDRAGASACRAQLNALASSTMAGVETFNTISSWSQGSGDKHPVSIAVGQKYAPGSAVPYGVSEIVAAPNGQGGCDGLTVQVLPSPLSCSKVRESMAARRGRQIGDLAGIPLMQESGVNTMLVPATADTCVLVATRTAYAR